MTLTGYKVRKAAQTVAFFALKAGGTINVLKLSKLVYLADREFMARYDQPILFDQLVSMEHGPVNSRTLNYVNGYLIDQENWDTFVSDRAGYDIGLANTELTADDLDELSDAEVDVLEYIWRSFGHYDQFKLRDWTHQHCQEWEDPDGSSHPIPYERVFKFLGKSQSAKLQERIEDRHRLEAVLCQNEKNSPSRNETLF